MRPIPLVSLILATSALGACSTGRWTPPEIAYDASLPPQQAVLEEEQSGPLELVTIPEPLPLPGQLMEEPGAVEHGRESANPRRRVQDANEAARIEPTGSGYVNAVQMYPFTEGALYQVYAAPGQITDIALQRGEQLVGAGPVAAGDTVRWIIGDTTSGSGPSTRTHILLKPTRSNLETNLIINTDRRTYHLELRSTTGTYMASVSWSYPEDELIALRGGNAAYDAGRAVASIPMPDLDSLNFRYEIEGDRPPWRPVRAFDDGRQVFIEFPRGIGQGEMPPIWIIGAQGDAQLVNYRVRGRYMVVDRLFAGAELRLGGRRQHRVRIMRSDARPDS